jgi:phenylacetate-CoA ligase
MSPADTPRSVAVHPADRLRALLSILPENPFYSSRLSGLSTQQSPLSTLPFTTKADLIADQHAHPPYGTILTYPLARYSRLHQTSGTSTGQPLCWLDTPESWQWVLDVWRQIFGLMGVRNGDRLFFPFSFGPFLGFWGAFGAANACGYLALPGGGMSSAARLRFMVNHAATVVFCTPSYALHLAEVAGVEGVDLAASPVRMLVAAGEPGASVSTTRERIETAWGARLIDHYGMTEIGPAAVECLENPGGMHVMANDYIAEVIDPATGDALPPGTIGELVLTNLGRLGSPLVRYRTGDLVRIDPKPCPCGRPWPRLAGGVLGRTDDMIHLRGNNLYPAALEAVIRRFAEVVEYRVAVDRTGPLAEVRIELESTNLPRATHVGQNIAERVSRAIRDELFFRADVVEVAPGTLPRFEMKAKRIINHETHETHEKRQN